MDDQDQAAPHADALAATADALLERLDPGDAPPAPAPPGRPSRLDSARLGRWIALTAGGTVVAILGSALAVILVVLQWSTRTQAAEDAANRQQASHASICHIIQINRHKTGEPAPTTPLGISRVRQWDDEYRRAGCTP